MPYIPNPVIPESMPVELAPVYQTSEVNEAVCLYEGRLDLVDDDQCMSGTGKIQLEWLPVPQVRFWMDAPDWSPKPGPVGFPRGSLKMADGRSVIAHVSSIRLSGGENATVPKLSGVVESSEPAGGCPITSVIFHLPNFRSFIGSNTRDESGRRCQAARVSMKSGDWEVTLDELAPAGGAKRENFGKQIEAAGGFGITHVGKLERSGGGTFCAADAKQLEAALFRFFSFCHGSWTGPFLAVGFDAGGERVWEEWREWKTERWRRVGSWFNTLSCTGLVGAFPGFIERLNDETWKEPVELAINWYVESNMCAGGVEGGTIMVQAAFELLAWTLLVEDRKVLSEDGFQKIPASDKLRLLLSACGIPLLIPASMDELSKVASEFNWQDGPQAITEVRNALVHASPKKRKKVLGGDAGVRHEAWWLGLWYLELVLLWLTGFREQYSNRLIRNGWKGQEVELVPWALKS